MPSTRRKCRTQTGNWRLACCIVGEVATCTSEHWRLIVNFGACCRRCKSFKGNKKLPSVQKESLQQSKTRKLENCPMPQHLDKVEIKPPLCAVWLCRSPGDSSRGAPSEAQDDDEKNPLDPAEKKKRQLHSGRSFGIKLRDGVTKLGFIVVCVYDQKPIMMLSTESNAVTITAAYLGPLSTAFRSIIEYANFRERPTLESFAAQSIVANMFLRSSENVVIAT